MPFYNVHVGYALTAKARSFIASNGIPSEIYQGPPVRVVQNNVTDAQLSIECADEQIANGWRNALINGIGVIEQYVPPVVEGSDPPRPADDVWSKVGTWTKTAGNATTVISGLPGQPKGLVLVGSGKAGATINTFNDYGGLVFGFSDGGSFHRLGSICAQDNVATQNTTRTINSRPFTLMDETQAGGAVITEVADSASFGATSFTINWSATTLATSGYYFVFGGSDITECKVKDYTIGTTAFGEIEYGGLGAMYDFCLLISSGFTGVGYAQAETGGAVWNLSCHAGHEDTKSWSVALTANDGVTPTQQWRLQKGDRLFSSMFTNGSNQGQIARFKGWTNDGFKIEWQDPPETSTTLFTGLFVKGGNWDAGTFVQPSTNSTFTHVLQQDPYQRIKGMMALSINNIPITNDSGVTGTSISMGAQDSAGSKACLAYAGNHGVNPSVESTVIVNNAFVKAITPAATASASTTNAECTVSNMATDGQFTINYTTTDSTPRQTVWFTLSA
jgi:hypothetical protein